jgi:ribosomal protein S18 acetylase RimI-like enzyme
VTNTASKASASFPAEKPERTQAPQFLVKRGFKLRWLRDSDLCWLRDLYASTRAEEMRSVPWDAQTKRRFLDQQFDLQHAHFVGHFGDSEFLAVELAPNKPIGRYYISRGDPMHIVDIALLPEYRQRGIGTALIEHTLAEARERQCSVLLHVVKANERAAKLYQGLGFTVQGDAGLHWAMRWSP